MKTKYHFTKTYRRKRKIMGMGPLDGYKDITKEEIKWLKKLTLKQAVKQTEILLKLADAWMK